MKKALLFIFIISLSACCEESTRPKWLDDPRYTSHEVNIDEMCTLIHNYLQQPDLYDFGSQTATLGGQIDSAVINKLRDVGNPDDSVLVLNFYTAYDTNKTPPVFLAINAQDKYWPFLSSPSRIKDNDDLDLSSDEFAYPYPQYDTTLDGVRQFLEAQNIAGTTTATHLRGEEVKNGIFNFLKKFEVNGAPVNYDQSSVFRKDYLMRLIGQQGCRGLRYFLGYDPSNKRNALRVILVGIKEDGTNMLTVPTGSTGPVMVEHSWPPCPQY